MGPQLVAVEEVGDLAPIWPKARQHSKGLGLVAGGVHEGEDAESPGLARRLYDGLSNDQIEYLFNITAANGIHQSLLQSPDLSFDWHGKAIIKGLHHLGPVRDIFNQGGKS